MFPKTKRLVVLTTLFTLAWAKAAPNEIVESSNPDYNELTSNTTFKDSYYNFEYAPIYRVANQTTGGFFVGNETDDLKTYPGDPYKFIPSRDLHFHFKVRTLDSASIALVPVAIDAVPKIEIVLGYNNNSKTIIWKDDVAIGGVEIATPDILSDAEFRGFWIQWENNTISVGQEQQYDSFLSVYVGGFFNVSHVGLQSKYEATWIVEDKEPARHPRWISARGGDIPQGAVVGGEDGGQVLYVARARHGSGLLPGKLAPSNRGTYVAWAGREYFYDTYEVLCNCRGCRWEPVTGDNIPSNALEAGETETGQSLCVGRANHQGTVTVGRVLPSFGFCYIPYGGRESVYSVYEVLTTKEY